MKVDDTADIRPGPERKIFEGETATDHPGSTRVDPSRLVRKGQAAING